MYNKCWEKSLYALQWFRDACKTFIWTHNTILNAQPSGHHIVKPVWDSLPGGEPASIHSEDNFIADFFYEFVGWIGGHDLITEEQWQWQFLLYYSNSHRSISSICTGFVIFCVWKRDHLLPTYIIRCSDNTLFSKKSFKWDWLSVDLYSIWITIIFSEPPNILLFDIIKSVCGHPVGN